MLDALAVAPGGELLLLSACGHEMQVKAVRALLCQANLHVAIQTSAKMSCGRTIRLPAGGGRERHHYLKKDDFGYRVLYQRLKPEGADNAKVVGRYHMIAMTKRPGLLPNLCEAALYQELRSPRFTTPFLREWVPWLADYFHAEGDAKVRQLHLLDNFRCPAAFLELTTEDFDEAVSFGLKAGFISIPERKVVA